MNTLGWQIGAFLIGASALIIAVYIGKLLILILIIIAGQFMFRKGLRRKEYRRIDKHRGI